jgi:hypothetical protein
VGVTIFTPSERFDVEYVPETVFVSDEMVERYDIGVGDEIY